MKLNLSYNDLIISGIVGYLVAKINKWDSINTVGIFITGSYLFNLIFFNNLMKKIIKY